MALPDHPFVIGIPFHVVNHPAAEDHAEDEGGRGGHGQAPEDAKGDQVRRRIRLRIEDGERETEDSKEEEGARAKAQQDARKGRIEGDGLGMVQGGHLLGLDGLIGGFRSALGDHLDVDDVVLVWHANDYTYPRARCHLRVVAVHKDK